MLTATLTTLGRRVELVSMDAHHESISIGLYLNAKADPPVATVHSFSRVAGTAERLAQIAQTMHRMAGMEPATAAATARFRCGAWHQAAARRLFLEACRHDPSSALPRTKLEAPDTRTNQSIRVVALGGGAYTVDAENVAADEPSRAPAIARGIAKLAELDLAEDEVTVTFRCGQAHDELIGLLLTRAQNIRAILREEELQASRGVLAAPSGQDR